MAHSQHATPLTAHHCVLSSRFPRFVGSGRKPRWAKMSSSKRNHRPHNVRPSAHCPGPLPPRSKKCWTGLLVRAGGNPALTKSEMCEMCKSCTCNHRGVSTSVRHVNTSCTHKNGSRQLILGQSQAHQPHHDHETYQPGTAISPHILRDGQVQSPSFPSQPWAPKRLAHVVDVHPHGLQIRCTVPLGLLLFCWQKSEVNTSGAAEHGDLTDGVNDFPAAFRERHFVTSRADL